MQIAICIGSQRFFIFGKGKFHFRSAANFKTFPLSAFVSLQIYPENAVRFQHRMGSRSNTNFHFAAVYSYNRNMFLTGSLNSTGFEFRHFLTAAYKRNA